MDAHHTIVLNVFQHLLFCISTRTSEGGGGGFAMSAKLEQGVCRSFFNSFNRTDKKILLRSLSATMSLSVSLRGSDFKNAMHCKS